ncbi:histidine kinase N-terminal 7TM domain-containing protein [Salinigranum marinum]|uniref:sensor histidine kinase n=1 Tax=Salinigranum marinum TaxID=1515595 RepID=UPI002989D1FE|nr:histidine kinase N-terminal 7TM domain-containing protein [Salinigranum marinum]
MTLPTTQLLYVTTFALATVGCLAGAWRAAERLRGDVRWGLVSLFCTSGLWAALTVAQLVATTESAKAALFTVGLVVGFATVGCWLYFVSAYSGRAFHRDPALRLVALVGFLVVTSVKLSNVAHHRYFSHTLEVDPFPHLVLMRHWPHWVVTAVAYTLVAAGFVLLVRMYARSGQDTGRVTLLAGAAGVPIVPDVVSVLRPDLLLGVTYEPVGVAVFAVGSLFVVESDFDRLRTPARTQVIDDLRDPVVVLDDRDRVQDHNPAAADLFAPAAERLAVGEPAPAALAETADGAMDETPVVLTVDGRPRHYVVRRSPVDLGPHRLGRVCVLTDVTRIESQRRDLRRQRQEMDNFAEAVAHELRNDLNIAAGYADILGDRLTADTTDATAMRAADAIGAAHGRIDDVVGDLATLAELAQSTFEVEPHALGSVVDDARAGLDHQDVRVVAGGDGTVVAEGRRLRELLSNLLAHAAARDAERVTVAPTHDGFVVRHDGRPIPHDRAASAFRYGTAVTEGIALANAGALARVHGWSLDLSTTATGETEIAAHGAETTVGSARGPVPAAESRAGAGSGSGSGSIEEATREAGQSSPRARSNIDSAASRRSE